jgi:hypothetical protein
MDGYVKAEEMAARWNVSARQVQWLCKNGKIESAPKFGNAWAIPDGGHKPTRTGKRKPGRKPKEQCPAIRKRAKMKKDVASAVYQAFGRRHF